MPNKPKSIADSGLEIADSELDEILESVQTAFGSSILGGGNNYPISEAKKAILALLHRQIKEARIDELEMLKVKTVSGYPVLVSTGKFRVVPYALIKDRLKQLREDNHGTK